MSPISKDYDKQKVMNLKIVKKIFVMLFLVGGMTNMYGQFKTPMINLEHFDEKRFQWGYYFGANTFDFKIDYKELNYQTDRLREIQTERKIGFNVGLTGQVHLIKYLDLRIEPGLVYNKRVLNFPGFIESRDIVREVPSTYIYIPMLLKFSAARWYNVKPYVSAGASVVFNLSSNAKLSIDNADRTFRSTKNVFFYELGLGFDFYTHYFRVSPSIRALFSVNNELVRDNDPSSPWTSNLNGIKTRGFLINLNFE